MKETLELNRACKPDHVSANMFMPLPGVDLTLFAIQKGWLDEKFNSPKSTHHIGEMQYPHDIKTFLYPYKSLFPLLVKNPDLDKVSNLLMRLPQKVLKGIDSGYRLYSNSKFYPPVRFKISDKLRTLRRYLAIISQ